MIVLLTHEYIRHGLSTLPLAHTGGTAAVLLMMDKITLLVVLFLETNVDDENIPWELVGMRNKREQAMNYDNKRA